MDILTVTCTRDKYLMQLLAHSMNLFVTDTCIHYVVIEDNDTSYGEWLTLLLPHYTRHQLKLVHDYNQQSVNDYGYYRQQQIKLQMANNIFAEKYIVIDSKTIFFTPICMADWPVVHGNSNIISINDLGLYKLWIDKVCTEILNTPVPDILLGPMTPFVIKTEIAKKLTSEVDVTDIIRYGFVPGYHEQPRGTWSQPSEFLLYTLYAMQTSTDIIPDDSKTLYWFCYDEEHGQYPIRDIENSKLVFGIDRHFLKPQYLKHIGKYYFWLLDKGIDQKYLNLAWFGPLFNSTDRHW